jgi:hypothetical protein
MLLFRTTIQPQFLRDVRDLEGFLNGPLTAGVIE